MSDTFTIHVAVEGNYPVESEPISRAAQQALVIVQATPPGALTITITSAERVHELNRQYAGIDSTTDVLSFGAEGESYKVEPGEPPYLGDVVIAYPVAEKQAQEAHLTTLNEIQLLAIHGTLHLLGYDHDTPERQAEMWAYQSAAMDAVRSAG